MLAGVPTQLQGASGRVAEKDLGLFLPPAAKALKSGVASVAHIAVLVSYDPQEVEAERQQGGAQQVAQGRQVRDGKTVGIFAAPPHGVHHPVGYAQQQQHLEDIGNMSVWSQSLVSSLLQYNMMFIQ